MTGVQTCALPIFLVKDDVSYGYPPDSGLGRDMEAICFSLSLLKAFAMLYLPKVYSAASIVRCILVMRPLYCVRLLNLNLRSCCAYMLLWVCYANVL